MKFKNVIFNCIIFFFLYACGSREAKEKAFDEVKRTEATEPEKKEMIQSETPTESKTEKNEPPNLGVGKMNLEEQKGRKFVRTAETRFKVKSVHEATIQIEDATAKYKGFVTYGNLRTSVSQVQTTAISIDSLLETKFYEVENEIVVRVPNPKLDSLIRDLNKLVDFMEYRIIKAEDVSLNLMEKELSKKRLDAYDKRISKAIDEKANKLDETTNAENNLLDKQTQADQNTIENLKLEDQVNYSTLKIFIYQREKTHRELIANYKNISAYRPNVFARIGEAFLDSLQIFEELLLFVIRIWFVFVIAIGGFILYRRYQKDTKRRK